MTAQSVGEIKQELSGVCLNTKSFEMLQKKYSLGLYNISETYFEKLTLNKALASSAFP